MPGEDAKSQVAASAKAAASASRNLQQRIVSGVVMIAIALALTYAGPVPFAALLLAVALVMCWEWGHLVRATSADLAFCIHATAVVTALGLAVTGQPALGCIAILIGAVLVAILSRNQHAVLSALGVPYVALPAMALVWLRQDELLGFAAVIFVFLTVWTTDTMAYVFGRSIGGAKLWPSVSPNKTWAGFIGGVGSSAAISAAYATAIPGASVLRLCAIGLALGVIAQAGDLAESALKRALGVKDASSIIPGHGGVMDRMDGVVTAAIAAALLAIAGQAVSPALMLLIGG